MSKLLGVIKAIIGQVYVVDASGAQRRVHEGDRVYSGEEIVTGANGAVSLSLPDGKRWMLVATATGAIMGYRPTLLRNVMLRILPPYKKRLLMGLTRRRHWMRPLRVMKRRCSWRAVGVVTRWSNWP